MCDHFLVLAQARAGSPASSCRGSCPTAPATLREGSGNVDALDVLRALTREPATVEVFVAEVETARGADRRVDAAMDRLAKELTTADEAGARRLVELMAPRPPLTGVRMVGQCCLRSRRSSLPCHPESMTCTGAPLVARLHVDFGHVSSAVCMRG